MRIAVIGTGAMGSLFSARLTPFVTTFMFGTWPEQVATLRRQPLRLIQPDGSEIQEWINVNDDLSQVPAVDLALVVVKCWQTRRAASNTAKLLAPGGLALTLQNGLGNIEILADALGPARASLGVTSEGATMLAPGTVRHAGHGTTHIVSSPSTAKNLEYLVELLRSAGFVTELVDDSDSLVWGKLAVNTGINPLTALLDVRNGFLAKNPTAKALMVDAARETESVAKAQGIELPYTSAAQRTIEVAEATAENVSSMLQDIRRGMPTEIDAISGAVIDYARQLSIHTPVNEALHLLVKTKISGEEWRTKLSELEPALRWRFESLAVLEESR